MEMTEYQQNKSLNIATLMPFEPRNNTPGSRGKFIEYDFGYLIVNQTRFENYSISHIQIEIKEPACFILHNLIERGFQFIEKGNTNEEYPFLPGENKYHFKQHLDEAVVVRANPGSLSWIQIEWDSILDEQMSTDSSITVKTGPAKEISNKEKICLEKINQNIANETAHLITFIFCLKELLHYYGSYLNEVTIDQEENDTLNKEILLEIKKDIEEDPNIHKYTIRYLMNKYRISRNSIKIGFTRLFNISISEFIENKCMSKALHLLANKKLTIDEIADELGYATSSNFSRAFKRYIGYVPSINRKNKSPK